LPHPREGAIASQICQGPHVPDPAQPIPGRRLLFGLLVILLVAVIPAIFVPTLMCRPAQKPLPDDGTVPAFSLVDESGAPFTQAALEGRVSIVDFVFTRCDTICPVLSMKMERIQEKTFDKGDKIKLVSFSVDPKYDTPAVLAEYAQRYHANPERWHFVTGAYDKVYALIEGPFMTSMMRLPDRPSGVPDIKHGGYFLLVDQKLHIRGIYDSNVINQLDTLIHDARYLARTGK